MLGLKPNTGVPWRPSGFYAKIAKGTDYGFFQQPQIPVYVGKEAFQIENRITNALPRAMMGDIASSIYFYIVYLMVR
jgi:hypothetical protein